MTENREYSMTRYLFPDDIDFTEIRDLVSCVSPIDNITCPRKPFGDITAEEYFKFAKVARERVDEAGLVEALSNTKRCFHYQVDRLLYRFALRTLSLHWKFPNKLELLKELHIVPGTLLRHFNSERNEMEHEYIAPTRETVDGSIDLCELLFLATERFLMNTPGRLRIKFKNDDRDLLILLEPGSDRLQFFEISGSKLENSPNGQYYSGNILDVTNKPRHNIKIKRIVNEDILIETSNKQKWSYLLNIFSTFAKEPERYTELSEEPMAALISYVPWKVVKQFLTSP
jgi:hypothetical protein